MLGGEGGYDTVTAPVRRCIGAHALRTMPTSKCGRRFAPARLAAPQIREQGPCGAPVCWPAHQPVHKGHPRTGKAKVFESLRRLVHASHELYCSGSSHNETNSHSLFRLLGFTLNDRAMDGSSFFVEGGAGSAQSSLCVARIERMDIGWKCPGGGIQYVVTDHILPWLIASSTAETGRGGGVIGDASVQGLWMRNSDIENGRMDGCQI